VLEPVLFDPLGWEDLALRPTEKNWVEWPLLAKNHRNTGLDGLVEGLLATYEGCPRGRIGFGAKLGVLGWLAQRGSIYYTTTLGDGKSGAKNGPEESPSFKKGSNWDSPSHSTSVGIFIAILNAI
jgi:hypothetical protein